MRVPLFNPACLTSLRALINHPSAFVPGRTPSDEAVPAYLGQNYGALVTYTWGGALAARPGVHEAESFRRMRMGNCFMDVPISGAFDMVAYVPHASCTASVTELVAS